MGWTGKLKTSVRQMLEGKNWYRNEQKRKLKQKTSGVRDILSPTIRTNKNMKQLMEMGYSEKEAKKILEGG